MDTQLLQETVHTVLPEATIHPTDLGGGDHIHLIVVDAAFEGQKSFQRQRPILKAFAPHIHSGRIHALDLKCLTPAEVEEKGLPDAFHPHPEGGGVHKF